MKSTRAQISKQKSSGHAGFVLCAEIFAERARYTSHSLEKYGTRQDKEGPKTCGLIGRALIKSEPLRHAIGPGVLAESPTAKYWAK